MTLEALVVGLEARGVMLQERAGRLVVRPARAVTTEELDRLRQAKPDVLAFLRSRALGIGWSRISLWSLDKVLEVSVPWSEVNLLIAPGCRIARELRAQDQRPGRIWCTCEVLDLLLSNVVPEDVVKIAQAKLALDGTVTVRPESGR